MIKDKRKIVLYASYQTGSSLPGYVKFALEKLAETEFHIVLLTNDRELSDETLNFLGEKNIELFRTENHGYDFGMWKRYLQQQARNNGSFRDVERLLLINDSVVYYKNIFPDVFKKAEASNADVVSLTENNEIALHLQSFFLYVKQPALGVLYMHLFETPVQETFYGVVENFEVGLSVNFHNEEIECEALYKTERPILFSYGDLICQGAGFVKRKLLQRRFTAKEKFHFIRHGALEALNSDYQKLILQNGIADDFKMEWLPTPVHSRLHQKADILWEKPLKHFGIPLLEKTIKLKRKIRKVRDKF